MEKPDFGKFPQKAGVYLFKGEGGEVLYVGKAKKIRNRIRSYFAKEIKRGPVIDKLVVFAKKIDFVETESEIEAILLEADLIKKFQPYYNQAQKDDKSFSMIRISRETFPVISLIRAKNVKKKDKTADYFGPYPSGEMLRGSLRYLRKIFRYRDCSNSKFDTYKKRERACLYGDINLCLGPCAGKIDESEYKREVSYFVKFLKGKKREVEKLLEREMKMLSREENFERAGVIRDRLRALSHLREVSIISQNDENFGVNSVFKRIEFFDISNISGQYAVGGMSVFVNGKSDKSEYRKFKIRSINGPNDVAMIGEVILRRANNDWDRPDLICVDGGEGQLRSAVEAAKRGGLNVYVLSVSKGKKRDKNDFHFSDSSLAKFFKKSPELAKIVIMARDEAHRFAISYYRKLHQKGMFDV